MPLSPPKKPPAPNKPTPQNHRIFDPWNSTSSGHQRADNTFSGTTLWRDTRSAKLKQQFRGEDCPRDSTGALGDEDFSAKAFDGTSGSVSPVVESYGGGSKNGSGDRTRAGEWLWVSEEEAKRAHMRVMDIRCFMGVGKRKAGDDEMQLQAVKKARTASERRAEMEKLHAISRSTMNATPMHAQRSSTTSSTSTSTTGTPSNPNPNSESKSESKSESQSNQPRQITVKKPSLAFPTNPSSSKLFTGTAIYINGSTLPQISDHKLRALLTAHGATIAIAMARRTVTHIIIGRPGTTGQGAGGGLAAGKLQGEIERGGWKGVKVVGVDWVLESINSGKRLAESRFAVLSVAPKGQRSVASMFGGR